MGKPIFGNKKQQQDMMVSDVPDKSLVPPLSFIKNVLVHIAESASLSRMLQSN